MGGNYYFGYWISNMDMILILLAIIATSTISLASRQKPTKKIKIEYPDWIESAKVRKKMNKADKKEEIYPYPWHKNTSRKIKTPDWLDRPPLR